PGLRLPRGMKINERQTSLKLDDLRRQDPDAPIRNFPGSELTAPGRTGLAASGLAPTTTKEEVWAFLDAREGDLLLNPKGDLRVLSRGRKRGEHEIWRLTAKGELDVTRTLRPTTDEAGEWLDIVDRRGKVRARYPIGYPFPYLPTGQRHPAFQLTDRLLESREPVVLPWMPKKWKTFEFFHDGSVIGTPMDGGPETRGSWRWTRGLLHVWIDGNSEAPEWTDVADMLGMERPKLWTVWDSDPERPKLKTRGPLKRDPDGRRPCSKYPAPCYGN
ncbi:MAG: hypothetical protein OXI73_09800, partial [Rhodospirillales bacterium]|nr:hypothetical protein [Rhodospirillales bacterium]